MMSPAIKAKDIMNPNRTWRGIPAVGRHLTQTAMTPFTDSDSGINMEAGTFLDDSPTICFMKRAWKISHPTTNQPHIR